MNNTFKFIALCLCAVLIAFAIYILASPKTLDFRGTVTAIEQCEDGTLLRISTADASYNVIANDKTKVSYCCKDDPSIHLSDIRVGDTVEGDYRIFGKDGLAKFITVQYFN